MSLDTMRDLLIDELSDIHSAERQLVQALPKLAKAATSPKLKQAFTAHLAETKGHVTRLDEVFTALGEKPKRKKCKGMEGLLAEGRENDGFELFAVKTPPGNGECLGLCEGGCGKGGRGGEAQCQSGGGNA